MHAVPNCTHQDMNAAERKIMAFIRAMEVGDTVIVQKQEGPGLTHIVYVETSNG